jgi:hypothetical protein
MTSATATALEKKVYSAWRDMKARCCNPSHKYYPSYGALGVNVQSSWIGNAHEFYKYVTSLPDLDSSKSIDRVDNTKGYEEGNIRWATPEQQVRNRGMHSNNSSGNTGVTWYYNDKGGTRAISWWEDEGKSRSKSFAVKKFGLLPAYAMAVNFRLDTIRNLNKQGAGYSESHGLLRGVK